MLPSVTPQIEDSVLLPRVYMDLFIRVLTRSWLPSATVGPLLYSGTRDGLTAADFHRQCDGKGPTLTLIRTPAGHVFGGYTAASWCSPDKPTFVLCGDAFLFSVTGPHDHSTLQKYPLLEGRPPVAIQCNADTGPVFGGGPDVMITALPTGTVSSFDGASFCNLGAPTGSFEDVLSMGANGFTGSPRFVPADIEVYRVLAV